MDEELISQVYQLTVNQPGVHLMEEHLVTDVKNARKDVLDNRIATDAALVECIEEFSST